MNQPSAPAQTERITVFAPVSKHLLECGDAECQKMYDEIVLDLAHRAVKREGGIPIRLVRKRIHDDRKDFSTNRSVWERIVGYDLPEDFKVVEFVFDAERVCDEPT